MDADTPRDPGTTPADHHGSRATSVAATQLRLLDARPHPEWCLDDTTREVGRRGVEAARAALRRARGHEDGSAQAPTAA